MRIALNSFPFERIGKIYQSTIVPAGQEVHIFYLEIPPGCVGFLDSAGITPDIQYKFVIDGESVNEIIGSITKPAIFDPPYLVRQYIAIYAKNNGNTDIIAQGYANGICYEELTLQPIVQQQKQEIQQEEKVEKNVEEIKEIKEKEQAAGIMFDKKVVVTDKVKMLYDKKNKGLNWTAVDITNAGPNPVYFSINEWRQPEAPLDINMTANIDLGQKGAIKKIYLVCDKGKSTIVYLRIMK